MKFIQGVLSFIVLATAFEGIALAAGDENETPSLIHYAPKPKSYSMQIKEFNECIACHEDDSARKEYVDCLSLFSEQNRKLSKECCELTYDSEFCQKASIGEINFPLICQNPKKAIEANRCFWQKTDRTTSDVQSFKGCRKGVIEKYCTTRSEGM